MSIAITIGVCSRYPIRICGQRAQVVRAGRPHAGEVGTIVGVTGVFARPHDGVSDLECVHIDEDSSIDVSFDDGWTCSYSWRDVVVPNGPVAKE